MFFEKSLLFFVDVTVIVDGHVQHIPSASAAYSLTGIYYFLTDIIVNMFLTFQQAAVF